MGHEGGDIERDAVLDFVGQLPKKDYTATIYRTLNQVNQPPFFGHDRKIKATVMDKEYLKNKIEGLRHHFVESTIHERAIGFFMMKPI